jgi:hypothetical protein
VLLSLVVGLEESSEGVEAAVVEADTPKIGFIRGRLRLGASSSVSWCEARRRFPKGEFLRPDMGKGQDGDGERFVFFLLAVG